MVPSAEPEGVLPVAVVLELLDAAERGDDPDEVSRIVARASLPSASAARVEDSARRLRGGAARWRRRGQELAALYSTARELAELRDVDELLQRLVERAHDLVGTDVSYLSEFDVATRELRVRTTLGAFEPSFRQLRVPPGAGLASLVVESRTPQWTSSYPDMTQAARAPELDAAVAAEGLVS
ncbi:MAG TPA: GAF domain-containing protein, partial [Pseudonocardia sp.]|nr:GAF domain-containing protein [Pseudonocardia sp.]